MTAQQILNRVKEIDMNRQQYAPDCREKYIEVTLYYCGEGNQYAIEVRRDDGGISELLHDEIMVLDEQEK